MKDTVTNPHLSKKFRRNYKHQILRLFLGILIFTGAIGCSDSSEREPSPEDEKAERDSLYSLLSQEQRRLRANAVAGLEVAEDLEVELFAAEPKLLNPTNMAIDAKGRVWITEAYNYRPQLNPENPQREKGDRIVILEDQNGDGKSDTTKVFYQGQDINAPLGIAVLGNKVIVSSSPNVYVFTDSDGDDKPDKKEVLFTGIGGEQHDHAMHAFVFGPDGKLYFNFGNEGGQLKNKDGEVVIDKDGNPIIANGKPYHQGMVFRSNLDGSEVEVLGDNFRNNYEVAVDSYGTLWQSDNDDDGNRSVRINYVMESGNYGYKDEMTGASWQAQRTNMEEEIPQRHWHLNDPGVVPNLLQTGAGSPTGMLVYEGNLLPEVFQDEVIGADAGPGVVRAFPVEKDGAGYNAEIANILEGARDQWFRPSDIAVAPDGSLFVADWYDPGVGGHQMGDMNRGRVYRVAPAGSAYEITPPDFSTVEGAIEALQNPNMALQYKAWTKIHEMGAEAEPALRELWESENPRFRARALWLLTQIEGKSDRYIEEALNDDNPDIRITGLRATRQVKENVIPYVKVLVKDPSPQVRREAAIALRHNMAPEAAELWAELAMQHDGQDRWYLEALGIGAEGQWDRYFNTWKEKAGNTGIKSPAGRDIVWRARALEALPMLADIIADSETNDEDRLRYFRAFDFHKDSAQKEDILLGLLDTEAANNNEINRLALSHLDTKTMANSSKAKEELQKTLASEGVQGTQHFVNLVDRYELRNQNPELLEIVLDYPDSSIAVQATRLLFKLGGTPLIKEGLSQVDRQKTMTLLNTLSQVQSDESMNLIQSVIDNEEFDLAVRQEAVKSLGSGWGGEERLLEVVRQGKLPEELEPTAASVLASVYRESIREEAAKLLNIEGSGSGTPMASIDDLVQRNGKVAGGKAVYERLCQICHVVNGEGTDFGPALSEIGDKLPKTALYESIIYPNNGISFGFEGYVLEMKGGGTVAGVIESQTEDQVSLKMPGGSTVDYDKVDITSITKMENSMMPGLEQAMTEQELVDLVEYLTSLKKKN